MVGLKVMEDQYVSWLDDSKAEEMDDAEVSWEIYSQEMPFDHSSKAERRLTNKTEIET